jgi:hypothetical protein
MEILFWYVVAGAAGMIVVALGYSAYAAYCVASIDDERLFDAIKGKDGGYLWTTIPPEYPQCRCSVPEFDKNQPVNTWPDTVIDFDSCASSAYLFEGRLIDDDDEEQTAVYDSGVVDLRKLQDDHRTWREHNFPGADDWQPLVGVSEELGEAAFAFIRIAATVGRIDHGYLKQAQGIRVGEDHRAEIVDAVGDLLLYVVDFANRLDIDLADALKTTWAEVSARDWQRNKVDGK